MSSDQTHQVKLELYDYQRKILESMPSEFGLLCEVGTGKTAIMARKIEELFLVGFRATLIVCPKSVCTAWWREFGRFTEIARYVQVISGTKEAKIKALQDPEKPIHIINYDSLNGLLGFMPRYDNIVLDESHWIKNHSAQRTKAIMKISPRAVNRFIMTGTPVTKSMLDLFSQFKFMDDGKTFGNNFYVFRAEYFEDRNAKKRGAAYYFPDWHPRKDSKDRIFAKISSKTVSLKKVDCLDLPSKVYKTLDCEMSKDQWRAYRDMRDELITYLDGGAATASIALTKALRMQQIASGSVTVTDAEGVSRNYTFDDCPKYNVLMEELESLTVGHKVIVWANFRDNLERIFNECQVAGYNPARMYSDFTSQIEIDKFQHDHSCRVMVANPQSGGTGVTMTASSVAIFFSNSFNFAHREQSEGRNHRAGSERHEKITYIDLVSSETIEEKVIEVLRERKSFAMSILDLKRSL